MTKEQEANFKFCYVFLLNDLEGIKSIVAYHHDKIHRVVRTKLHKIYLFFGFSFTLFTSNQAKNFVLIFSTHLLHTTT